MTTTEQNAKPTLGQRLLAAWDLLRGNYPQQRSVVQPFFYGFGPSQNGSKRSGLPAQQRITIDKLRAFSATPIVRRLVNYLRFTLTNMRFDIVAIEGETLKKKHETAIKRLKRFLRSPNPDDTWEAWLGKMLEDMLVAGWGISEIVEFTAGGDDKPYLFWPVDGTSVQVDLDWRGEPRKPRYWQTDFRGNDKPFLNSELMVFKYVPRTSTPFGLSPIQVAITEIEYLLDALAFAGRIASNAQPKKMLWLEGLNNDQINQIRLWWRETVEGSGAMPILGGDGKANTLELGLITDQNLFLKWQEFLIAIIADAFGIDVQKVNLIVGINRSTGDKLDDTTDSGAIEPLATMIEQYIDKYILPLFGLADVAQFKFLPTSLGDIRSIAVVNQVELQDDSITINQARKRKGEPPLLHPVTGEDVGEVTLSYYREIVKVPEFRTKGFAGLEEALKRQQETADALTEAKTSPQPNDGTNSNNTKSAKSERGGNGVNSAKKPKDKAYNTNAPT